MNPSNVDTSGLQERLEFVGLDQEQLNALGAVSGVIVGCLDDALETFYAKITANPQTAKFFGSDSHVKSARARQGKHWSLIASGQYDAQYVQAVTMIGKTHARLGLEPRWYIGGYSMILEEIVRTLISHELSGRLHRRKARKLGTDVAAVMKAALVDMDYSISTYLDALKAERETVERERQRMNAEQQEALAVLDACLVRLAEGDLTATIQQELAPQFADLRSNFNNAVEQLENTFGRIVEAADDTATNARELTAATDDMARRTEQQAAALEETAAALEEITTISRQAASRTKDAQQVAATATGEAVKSRGIVEEAITAMSAIEDSSQKITRIIGVIDEISFQTNLLALNAGVEAARAGDAGRGFAVVAQEVRQLAQRSATAAKEIKTLIGKSSADVAMGVSLVNQAGDALNTIGAHVEAINSDVDSIATSASEQSTGMREINAAVNSMDRVTQQNAAMVEQTNASTHSLMQISQTLTELVGRFTVSSPADVKPARAA